MNSTKSRINERKHGIRTSPIWWSWPHHHHHDHDHHDHHDIDGCCPQGWTQVDDHCYIFQSEVRTFADAESVCNTLGGNLASIHSYLENLAVAGLIKEGGADYAWIGLHDAIKKGNYIWTDGTNVEFLNFAPVEPNGTGACVELYVADFTFFDEDCTIFHPYVCTRETYHCGHH
uniref:lactose-binding lectin l-2-like n=1 Tax=Doryrhamphus excisus TaxID=161450 RepID=UPI0025ADB8F4|nr:lactose-binding lectin l-2-like [Doryrhamphus excisus]